MIIQDIEYTQRCVRITLDNGERLSIDENSIPHRFLHKGVQIDIDAYTHLKEESTLFECKEKALHYIGVRSRTEQDIKKYLLRKGFDKNTIITIIKLFTEKGFINDYEYSVRYIHAARERKIVGNRMIEKKLHEKGIQKAVIKKAMKILKDDEPAPEHIYQLAHKKYNQVKNKKHPREKVSLFLMQRGFEWDDIKNALKRLEDDDDNFVDV